ncbi:MAG: hypothetical protein LBN21_00540 [Treponema sp.]|jgi:hypothetical protein|nr:hypothetical protein [Treponema sp.]
MPVFFLGAGFAANFWRTLWPLALILVLILIGMNVYFGINRRLFLLLEREDWPALVDHLEHRVLQKSRYSPGLVRLLANSYLVMSDSAGVTALENKAAIAKPALLEKNALVFGAARILGGDPEGAANFFAVRLEKARLRARDKQWVHWYYGFSLLLARQFTQAAGEFKVLAASSNDALITGLSVFFLSDTLLKYAEDPAEYRAIIAEGRERVIKALKTPAEWDREAARIETEVHAAILQKYINQAGTWLFDK